MEHKTKAINIKNIFILSLILSQIADIVTTLMATHKHGVLHEMNPIFNWVSSYAEFMAVIVGVKIILIFLLVVLTLNNYYKIKYGVVRYFIVYMLVFIVVVTFAAAYNNYLYYKVDGPEIGEPIPQEQKAEAMNEAITTMSIITHPGPQASQKSFPILYVVMVMNIMQFLVWRSFEIHWRKPNDKRRNHNNDYPDGVWVLEK